MQNLPIDRIGLILSMGAFLGILFTMIIGRVADKIRIRRVLTFVLIIRAIGYGSLIFVTNILSYGIIMIIANIGDQATPGLQQALIGQVFDPNKRTNSMSTMRAVKILV